MEKGILPNEEMLKVNGIENSIEEIFDEISIFISQKNLSLGLKKDLEALFISQSYVSSFTNNFRQIFQNLKKEKYSVKKKLYSH